MKHSSYLDWYINVPQLKYDFRSSGVTRFKYDLMLGNIDLSINYARGNPEASELLARRYHVHPENVFISSEGASGQNTRIIRHIAERNRRKNEAVIEYPTYEPLLRKVQGYFSRTRRFERKEEEAYRLDADELRKVVSDKTGLLVLTNPHAPSGIVSVKKELEEIMNVAREHGFCVLCDEIYAEFDRKAVPVAFCVNSDLAIVTTSFTKAYGLGGLKLGIALAGKALVDELYKDVLYTVGNSPNIVQLIAVELLTRDAEKLENHKKKWLDLKNTTEKWFKDNDLGYFPNKVGVTYWLKLPVGDTYNWVNEYAIPNYSLAAVPGAFFLFESGYKLAKSSKIRLGLGNIAPDRQKLMVALEALETALNTYQKEVS